MQTRHMIDLCDLSTEEWEQLTALACDIRDNTEKYAHVCDGKIITGAGMGVALDFGLALVAALRGKEAAAALRRAVLAD